MYLCTLLNNSDLPENIQNLIRAVVRRTRLRKAEKLDVANELISHFQDSLEGGIEPENVILDYGDITVAAKLLRKAKKRQRWWVEVVFARTFKWGSATFGCFLLIYAVLVVLALGRKPNVSVDYVAKLNEGAAAVPEEDRGWPFYREAAIALRDNPRPDDDIIDEIEQARIDELGWLYYKDWVSAHQKTIALILEGTTKTGLGYIATNKIAEEDKELWPDSYGDEQEVDTKMVLNVLLPQLGHMRRMAFLLQADAMIAAKEGNSQACVSDINALMQVAVHVRELPILINDLVSLSIFHLSFEAMRDIIADNPSLFTHQQIQALLVQLRSLDSFFAVRFEGERMIMLDVVQHVFTDDGKGDGLLIPQNLLATTSYIGTFTNADPIHAVSPLFAPLGDWVLASRKEFIDEYERRMERITSIRGTALRDWEEVEEYSEPTFGTKYFLIDLLMPGLRRTLLKENYIINRRDGMLAVLYAVEQYQLTGQWPTDLSGAGVVDGWSGKPFLIAEVDGAPVIYSIGADQDDDGGMAHSDAFEWKSDQSKIPDGDWVFFSPKK